MKGDKYDDLTRSEKDNYLWWANVGWWRAKNKPELTKMAQDAKNEDRRWRKHHKSLIVPSGPAGSHNKKKGGPDSHGQAFHYLTEFHQANYSKKPIPMLMSLPEFTRWIESHSRPTREPRRME